MALIMFLDQVTCPRPCASRRGRMALVDGGRQAREEEEGKRAGSHLRWERMMHMSLSC